VGRGRPVRGSGHVGQRGGETWKAKGSGGGSIPPTVCYWDGTWAPLSVLFV